MLEKNSTVTWRMEIPKNAGITPRLYGDELYKDILGLKRECSPEETFAAVINMMEPEYKEVLAESVNATIRQGQAEAIYEWNHPKKGKVQLRSSSSLDYETEEYYSLVGYIHIMKDVQVFTIKDVHSKIKNALEEMYFCNFYIKLSDYSYEVYKAQPYMTALLAQCENAADAVNAYITYMVSEDSKEKMAEFLDLKTIKQRMKHVNLLEASYNDPNIGWARAKYIVVEREKQGEPKTVALVVEALE